MPQEPRDVPDVHEAFLLDEQSVSVSLNFSIHDLWVGDMLLPEDSTHGTSFVPGCFVAASSPGRGGQVSVSPFPRSHSTVLSLESVKASCIMGSFSH